jgi:hypothetical protein
MPLSAPASAWPSSSNATRKLGFSANGPRSLASLYPMPNAISWTVSNAPLGLVYAV